MNGKSKRPEIDSPYAPKPKAPPIVPPADAVLAEFDAAIEQIKNDVNAEAPTPPEPPPRPVPEFVSLAEKCADALVQSAEAALTQAQNNLQQAKLYADELRAKIREHDEMVNSITGRLNQFGADVLNAHRKFHE